MPLPLAFRQRTELVTRRVAADGRRLEPRVFAKAILRPRWRLTPTLSVAGITLNATTSIIIGPTIGFSVPTVGKGI
jgi:hypothetical protein